MVVLFKIINRLGDGR